MKTIYILISAILISFASDAQSVKNNKLSIAAGFGTNSKYGLNKIIQTDFTHRNKYVLRARSNKAKKESELRPEGMLRKANDEFKSSAIQIGYSRRILKQENVRFTFLAGIAKVSTVDHYNFREKEPLANYDKGIPAFNDAVNYVINSINIFRQGYTFDQEKIEAKVLCLTPEIKLLAGKRFEVNFQNNIYFLKQNLQADINVLFGFSF